MVDADDMEAILGEQYPNLYEALKRQNYYTWTEAMEDLADLINSFQMPEELSDHKEQKEGQQ